MDKRLIVAAAVLAIVAFIAIVPSLGISLTGDFPFFAVEPQVISAISPDVFATAEDRVPVVIFTSTGPINKVPTASVYALAEQEVMALSVRLMTVYNFEPYRYSPLFGVVAGWMPKVRMQQAFADPAVRSIDYDRLIQVPLQNGSGVQYLTLDEVAQRDGIGDLWANGWQGAGVKIAYLDTGAPPGVVDALAVGDVDPGDQYGHGTMVHDVISTLAPDAYIVSIKVLDDFGSGRISTVIRGIEMAVMEGTHVVNMSLGVPPGGWDSLGEACRLAEMIYGVKIFAASGNSGEQGTLSPATSSHVVSVAALDADGEVTVYSSRGKVETAGFGDIRAQWLDQQKNLSGTSCAAPQAAALYTCWLSGHPETVGKNVDQFAVVKGASLDLPPEGHDRYTGWGLLSGQALSETDPSYIPSLWERLALPFILLAIVVCVIVGIAITRKRRFD